MDGIDMGCAARTWRRVFTLSAFCMATATASAGVLTDHEHFSLTPQALTAAATSTQVPDGADVAVAEVQETYRFDADGSSEYTQYFVYRILTPQGAEVWNELAVYWSPWLAERPSMKARVVAADGTAYSLDPATIADSPVTGDASIYSDQRMLRAPLPAIAPGAVVETEIVLKERTPFAGAGKIGRSFFRMEEPVEHFRLTLQAPTSLPLRHRMDLLPTLKPTHTQSGGMDQWVFEASSIPANEEIESGLPGDVPAYPMITFSTGVSWNEVAKSYSQIVAARLAEARLGDLVAKLIKGRDSTQDKASALVEYLNREIRYTGIEFDQSSIFPHTTAETLGRRYGDCKDKALLLVAMLRAANIPADMALLNAGDRLDVPPELPGMGLFDHAIVYVPGEQPLWIDATAETARLGQLPDMDRGRWALIINPGTDALTRIDEARSSDNVVFEEREVRLADNGPAQVLEISRPQGTYESDYRRIYANLADKDTRNNLTDYVKAEYLAARLDKVDSSDAKNFSQPFRLTLESSESRRADTSLSQAVAYIRRDGLLNYLPYDLRTRELSDEENAKATRPEKKRTNDYQLPRPFRAMWKYRIVPPRGFRPGPLPPDATIAIGPLQFVERFATDADGAIRAELTLDTIKRRFTAEEVSVIRNKVAELLAGEAISLRFDLTAHLLLTQGQPKESFDAYRELIRQDPKDAIQHLRRADGLLQAGMTEAARAEVAQAIKLDPKSAFAQETMANVLQYDSIGRWHQEGADYAGAAAAYRAAIALDPDDKRLVGNYAILLEHDSRGMRYGEGADLNAAIAEYRKLSPQQLSELGLANNLPFALFYARQFASAREAAESLESPPVTLIVACDVMTNGIEYALDQAHRRSNNDARYREIVTTAGQMLMYVREYPDAAALLEAGASGSSMARTMGLATVLRQAKRHEELQFDDTPADLIRKMLVRVMTDLKSIDDLAEFESRNARLDRQRLSSAERDEAMQSLGMFRTIAARSGVPASVLLDISMQSLQVKVIGNDSLGYRTTLAMPNMSNQSFFVVKEEGHYRVLDNHNTPVALAMEVLDRLDRDDLAGAGALLDWLREVMPNDNGNDPFSGHPFPKMWTVGQQHDAQDIAVAAASLLVQTRRSAQRGVTILEQAKMTNDNPNVELSLLTGYSQLRNREKALEAANALAILAPASKRVFFARIGNLVALKRFGDAQALAEQRLQTRSNDIEALRALQQIQAAQHDYVQAYQQGVGIVDLGESGPSDLNNLAWLSLFFDREGGPDVASAVRAAQGNDASVGSLHTLGCIYAELGKTREAREVLLQSLEARRIAQPYADFWYPIGRIAEQYGERDIALASYAKVKPPADPALEYESAYRLAQRRIATLGGARRRGD
jgi:transglutaminase-like putative cysteine protease/Flp pilus assembly protein TadD